MWGRDGGEREGGESPSPTPPAAAAAPAVDTPEPAGATRGFSRLRRALSFSSSIAERVRTSSPAKMARRRRSTGGNKTADPSRYEEKTGSGRAPGNNEIDSGLTQGQPPHSSLSTSSLARSASALEEKIQSSEFVRARRQTEPVRRRQSLMGGVARFLSGRSSPRETPPPRGLAQHGMTSIIVKYHTAPTNPMQSTKVTQVGAIVSCPGNHQARLDYRGGWFHVSATDPSSRSLPAIRVHRDGSKWAILEGTKFMFGAQKVRCTYKEVEVEASDVAETSRSPSTASEHSEQPVGLLAKMSASAGSKPGLKKPVRLLQLELVSGNRAGEVVEVGPDGCSIGRGCDATVMFNDLALSSIHVTIEMTDGSYYLSDPCSLNGVFVELSGPYSARFRIGLCDHIMLGETVCSINRFDYGVSERVGYRPTMEDKSVVIQDLRCEALGCHPLLSPQTFAAVYDGHGGAQAAEYLWSNLHGKLGKEINCRAADLLRCCDSAEAGSFTELDALVRNIFTKAYRDTDTDLLAGAPHSASAGSTCTRLRSAAMTTASTHHSTHTPRKRVYTANVGDSRTLLGSSDGRLLAATKDHKPHRADELGRIRKAGGFVIANRVMGELAVSRAFGDVEFKGKKEISQWDELPLQGSLTRASSFKGRLGFPLITPDPEVDQVDLNGLGTVLLACDGLFDVMTNAEVMEFIHKELAAHGSPQRCVEALTEHSIYDRYTRDNVTVVLLVCDGEQLCGVSMSSAPRPPSPPSVTCGAAKCGEDYDLDTPELLDTWHPFFPRQEEPRRDVSPEESPEGKANVAGDEGETRRELEPDEEVSR